MANAIKILFGATSYLVGLGGLTYFVLFLGGWDFLPRHIDSGAAGSLASALVINLGLMLLFGLQHSVMARPGFKRVWTKVVPAELERATYVLTSGLFMLAFAAFWQPMGGVVWNVDTAGVREAIIALYAFGFLFAVAATYMIDHFDLFGMSQVIRYVRKRPAPKAELRQVGLYRIVRHPIQTGMLLVLWCTPTMSATHFLLTVTMTAYVFVGLYFEERELVRTLGPAYEDYRANVNKLIPWPRRQRSDARSIDDTRPSIAVS